MKNRKMLIGHTIHTYLDPILYKKTAYFHLIIDVDDEYFTMLSSKNEVWYLSINKFVSYINDGYYTPSWKLFDVDYFTW